ncbi:MAG: hypothetical protein ABI891_03150 [Acidobacteriota bacterium]
MTRKYSRDNPLPKAELRRMRRNTQSRIRTRTKAQTTPETVEQFGRLLVEAITSKNKRLNPVQLKTLDSLITERVKDFVTSENDDRLRAARRLKDLFAEYGLGKKDLMAAIKLTKWAKLNQEILELEIKKGVDEIDAGYYTVLEGEAELKNFFEKIRLRVLKKMKAKQRLKDKSVQV